MHDPFPIPNPAFLRSFIQPFADRFHFQTLPLHIHEVAFSFLLYHIINIYVSPALSSKFFPRIYNGFSRRTKIGWDVHVVSFTQSTLICAMSFWAMWTEKDRNAMDLTERVWGYTGFLGLLQAFGCGYFLWDLWISIRYVNVFGWSMLAHAVSALLVFSFGWRPFLNFYGPTFLLYELSSPFLNIHWFCDKLALTGSNLQLYNGIVLICAFFGCRLCWGTYQSVKVFYDVYLALRHPGFSLSKGAVDERSEILQFAGEEQIPLWLGGIYLASNITLNTLNFIWFGKMIDTLRKRFDPPFGTRTTIERRPSIPPQDHVLVEGIDVDTDENAEEKSSGDEDISLARGVFPDGRTTVEVEKTEVRQRKR